MTKQISTERLNIVDTLRGFSLMGIVLVHFMEQYYGGSTPSEHNNYTQHIPSDGVFDMLMNILLRGKFFMLFSFLFGLSFFLQMDHAAEKGANFSGRFLWRLFLLFAIGFVHHLFYRGDILTVYALLGIPLIAFYKVPDKWALTNYVLQTLIGTTIFFGFGLGKLGNVGSTITFVVGLSIFMLQRLFSQWWLQRYHFGFLEWLWRSLTFFKWQAFKK